MEMEKGFETVLYEDGTNISAGQRKRIAIARAFLKDAPIMLLDEFSGNLDKEMANKILESLFDNSEKKMLIAITHEKDIVSKFEEVIQL